MLTKHARPAVAVACVVGCMMGPGAALADDFGSVELHGFGMQNYLQTSHNTYDDADHRGTWDDNFLGLVAAVTINDRMKLWAQVETSSRDSTHFTWFFVDYQFSNNLSAHAGRVKFPLGIYNEIIDTKFLQITSLEPFLYRGEAPFVDDAYNGAGLNYNQELGTAGALTWQVYGGNTFTNDVDAISKDRRLYGLLLTYRTPIEGLRLLFSAFHVQTQLPPSSSDQTLHSGNNWIASVDYVHADWDVKSEYGQHKLLGITSDAYYVQAGRTFARRWMGFARYDYITMDKSLDASDSYSQKDFVVGLNFKVRDNVSLRVEDQFNRGYALPVATREVQVDAGTRAWSLLVVGINFIF